MSSQRRIRCGPHDRFSYGVAAPESFKDEIGRTLLAEDVSLQGRKPF